MLRKHDLRELSDLIDYVEEVIDLANDPLYPKDILNILCYQGQTGIKLGAKHVMCLKLANFWKKKDIYIKSIGIVIFSM